MASDKPSVVLSGKSLFSLLSECILHKDTVNIAIRKNSYLKKDSSVFPLCSMSEGKEEYMRIAEAVKILQMRNLDECRYLGVKCVHAKDRRTVTNILNILDENLC